MKTTTTSVNKCERKKRFNVKIKDTLMFVIMKLCVCVCVCTSERECVMVDCLPNQSAYQRAVEHTETIYRTLYFTTPDARGLHRVFVFVCLCARVCVCVYARHPNFTSITTMTDTFINPGPQCVQYLMC